MAQVNAGAGDTPAKLFRGYDSVGRGMLSSSAVTGQFEQTGGRSVVNIRVCESVSELAQALEIDGSLSVSYLKAVNVTAKMNFMKKLNVTARSVTIVVYASHETGTWAVKDIALKGGVTAPDSDAKAAAFVQSYGDSSIKEATQGGEYYAVYTFRTETRSEQTSLTSSLKAKGIYTGVTAKLDLQVKLSEFMSSTSVNWTFDQEITGIANPGFPTQDKLIEFALAFPSKPLDSPVTTGFAVEGYERVPGFGGNFKKVVANRRYFLGASGLLQKLARVQGLQHQIAWLRRIYARYNYQGDAELNAFKRVVEADLDQINEQIDAWDDDPTGKFDKLTLPSLDKGEPVLTFAAGQPASFGGEGGGPFDFMSVGDAFRNQVRIVSIRLADETVIRRMEVEYASERDRWKTVHGSGGNTHEIFYLEDGQFPTRLKIRSAANVDRIEVHLADGRSTWAGGNGGTANDWAPGEGAVVLGFAGRSGANLDQIKIIHGALKPARYVAPA
jgi:hypothetical protein